MKLMWVFLIYLQEAQPATVNVNVKVKGNTNDKDMESPQLPILSSRWLFCQSALWTKECKEGKLILKTVKDISDTICGLMCRDMKPHCKRYFFEEKSGDCALSTVSEGTTTSNGISGPELLSKPHPLPSASVNRYEDCSEFHFEVCSIPDDHHTTLKFEQQEFTDRETLYTFVGKDERENCMLTCSGGSAGKPCNAYGFKTPSNNPVGADCALHDYWVDDYIHYNCYITIGRADRDDPEKFESCLFRVAESTKTWKNCRSGYCDLEHFGEAIAQAYAPNELDCMRICSCTHADYYQTKSCTHWKYHPTKAFNATNEKTNEKIVNPVEEMEGQCLMYYVDPSKDYPSYKCDMVVEEKDSYLEFNCRKPIKPYKGYEGGER